MSEETPEESVINLPESVEQAYIDEIDEVTKQLRPEISDFSLETTERLYLTYHRVFDALGYTPPEQGTLVELGIGGAPYLAAVQTAFHPAEHIGIDSDPKTLEGLHARYPDLPAQGMVSVRTEAKDAIDPAAITGFDAGQQVDEIVALHPDISTYGKEREGSDESDSDADDASDEFEADENMLTQLYNWQQRLKPDGIMVIVTVFKEEAEAIFKDSRLNQFVHLYGITAAISEFNTPDVAYVVALRANPRDGEPIVWEREQYREYGRGSTAHLNPNMFSDDDEGYDDDDA